MEVSRELLEQVLAHAREAYDAECCGMIAYADGAGEGGGERDGGSGSDRAGEDHASEGRGDLDGEGDRDGGAARRAARVYRATNVFAGRKDAGGNDAGRKRFEIDGREVLRALNEFEDAGLDLGAIYHSHTHTAPYPSQTDINFAAKWPGVEWLIVGLAGDEPEVRCYLIEDGEVSEVPVEVR